MTQQNRVYNLLPNNKPIWRHTRVGLVALGWIKQDTIAMGYEWTGEFDTLRVDGKKTIWAQTYPDMCKWGPHILNQIN